MTATAKSKPRINTDVVKKSLVSVSISAAKFNTLAISKISRNLKIKSVEQ